VKEAAVWGKPDPLAGELPTAFVVLQPDHQVTEQELAEFVAGKDLSPINKNSYRSLILKRFFNSQEFDILHNMVGHPQGNSN